MASEPPSSQMDYDDVLYTALETGTTAMRDASPLDQLTRVVEAASSSRLDDPGRLTTLAGLRGVLHQDQGRDA